MIILFLTDLKLTIHQRTDGLQYGSRPDSSMRASGIDSRQPTRFLLETAALA
jgi:hypothetical protein